jgi:hypothetical protein
MFLHGSRGRPPSSLASFSFPRPPQLKALRKSVRPPWAMLPLLRLRHPGRSQNRGLPGKQKSELSPARQTVKRSQAKEDEAQARAFLLAQAARDRRDVQPKSHRGTGRARRVRAYRPRHREGHGKAQLSGRTVALHRHQYCRRNDPLSEGAGAHHRSHRHTGAGRANYRSQARRAAPRLYPLGRFDRGLCQPWHAHPAGRDKRNPWTSRISASTRARSRCASWRSIWARLAPRVSFRSNNGPREFTRPTRRRRQGQEIGIGSGPRCCYRLNVAIYAAISAASRGRGEKFIFGCGPAMA